jgi:glycine cleavage system H protein
MNIPNTLIYTREHLWIKSIGDATYEIGITDFAQNLLGDVVFVELPELDSVITAGEEAGVVESVKAASDIFSPISGTVIEINEALEESPELVNSDPYDDGWFYKVKISDADELSSLLSAEEYTEVCDSEDH